MAMFAGIPLLGAQQVRMQGGDGGPRFLRWADARLVPLDVDRAPLLQRRIDLTLDRATLRQALAAISEQAGLHIVYDDALLPPGGRFSLKAQGITVVAALTDVLANVRVDVVFAPDGRASLEPRDGKRAMRTGSIAGRVTEKGTGTPVGAAQVSVAGTGLSRYTDEKGQYRIPDVPVGEREITVRRLGFEAMTRTVRVSDGEAATVDFAVGRVATTLTQLVTTATGERSRLEVGNSVGTIKADSVVATTLIRSMTDLLTARTPGVVVTNSTGLVGSPSIIRIRGVSSITLSNDPIIILDGVRLAPVSSAGLATSVGSATIAQPVGFSGSAAPVTSRLDDIDPNTIESIDVLRGPSASSLYGTDAGAGVIVIKTKKGIAGAYRLNAIADQGSSRVLGDFPVLWFPSGHTQDGTPTKTCKLYRFNGNFSNVQDGSCVIDSVVAFDTYNDPRLTTLGQGQNRSLSLNLSGGPDRAMEFLSLRLSDATGMPKLSAAEASRIARMWPSSPPSWVLHPNTEQNVDASSRSGLQLTRGLDLSLQVAGVYRKTLSSTGGGLFGGAAADVAVLRPQNDTLEYLPAEQQRARLSNEIKRGYGAVTANYTPLSWLALHATLGADYTLRSADALGRASDCTPVLFPSGCPSGHNNTLGQTYVTTVDVGAQATWMPLAWLSLRTSAVEQLGRTQYYELQAGNASGTNLAFGTELLSPSPVTTTGTQLYSVAENRDESATAGWGLEETASIHDRLFVTASFRQDLASAFGDRVNDHLPPVYPRYSLSWVVSDEPFFPKLAYVSSLRLRSAYGHSGQEARQSAVLDKYQIATVFVDGVTAQGLFMASPGNSLLRPERSTELEGGFDLSLFADERIRLEATLYRKLTRDAIITRLNATSLGLVNTGSMNLGAVENRGLEMSATVKVLDHRAVAWDVTVNGARNTNKLVSKVNSNTGINDVPKGGDNGDFVGYPLQSYFTHVVTGYTDSNGDGILQFNEVRFGFPLLYQGSPNPDGELTYISAMRLWDGAIQVNATFDEIVGRSSRTGSGASTGLSISSSREFSTPVPLAEQAAMIQANYAGATGNAGFTTKNNTLRFAELSVIANAPRSFAMRVARAQGLSVTVAARNLALWTSSIQKDPNVTDVGATNLQTSLNSPNVVPQPMDITFRINLRY